MALCIGSLVLTVALMLADSNAESNPIAPLLKLVSNWLITRWPIAGVVVVVGLVCATVYVFWNWDKFKNLIPVVRIILTFLTFLARRGPLPRPKGRRFAIAVARVINDDEEQSTEKVVIAALKGFAGVEVLRFNREIHDDDLSRGHAHARQLLRKTGAHALLWGEVLKKSVPRLYWTSQAKNVLKDTSENYQPAEDLTLPEIFWDDLKQVLNLVVATAAENFAVLEGRYSADRLKPFVVQVRELLKRGTQRQWDSSTLAPIRLAFGNALRSLGEQTGDNHQLDEAIAAYRHALEGYTRERVPLDWATTQNNLARERVPLQWAMTQNNLGAALSTLGERESGTGRLEEAVTAYRAALLEYTRERVPLQWAMTQNNLGNALSTLGERENDPGRLEAAVDAYQDALLELTRERVPFHWEITQNNLDRTPVELLTSLRKAKAHVSTPTVVTSEPSF
jgi:tetratricopeptide (TPR) repeat protein